MQIKQSVQKLWQKSKAGFLAFIKRRDPAEYFMALMILSLTVFVIRVLIAGPDAFVGVFFKDCGDLFLDFFNSLRDVAQGIGVYTERHVIYPPLANLILALIARVIPGAYLNTPGEEKFTWREYPSAILALLFFFVFTFLVLALLLNRDKLQVKRKGLFVFLVLVSFPFLTLLERGNVVVICLITLLVYMQCYDSENKAVRELGLIMLATATALKIYPAIFGLILLCDKRFKDAVRAAVYALLLLIIPSFFYGGPQCLWWVVENTIGYSEYASQNASSFFVSLNLPDWSGMVILFGLYLLAVAVLTCAALLQRKPWKIWVFGATILMSVASIFSSYNWLLILPGMLMFFRTEKLKGLNWLYFILITLPFYYYFPKEWQGNMLVTLIVGLYILSVAESVVLFRNFFKARKAAKAEIAEQAE